MVVSNFFIHGHISLINFAVDLVKGNSDNGIIDGFVILALNTNDSIRRIKGDSKIIFTDMERYEIFNNIKGIDLVFFFHEDTPEELIKTLKPDFIVKRKRLCRRRSCWKRMF